MHTRWTIKVAASTDRALREHLARHGGRKGSLSRFIEEAVLERLQRSAIERVQVHNAGVPDEQLEALVADALRWARGFE